MNDEFARQKYDRALRLIEEAEGLLADAVENARESKLSFTPGPWLVYGGDGCLIGTAQGNGTHVATCETANDARFISAAPIFYKAAELSMISLIDFCKIHGYTGEARIALTEIVRALLIAKGRP